MRPKDIVEKGKTPRFYTGGAEANDVVQGQIGDCWFVSALSTLATDDY